MANDKDYLVIALSDHLPVRIKAANWPVIAQATDHNGDAGNSGVDAAREWQVWVRQNRHDGRLIVYGLGKPGPRSDGEPRVEAGYLLDRDGNVTGAIKDTCFQIGSDRLAEDCLGAMPPQDLDDDVEENQRANELLDSAFMALHYTRGTDPETQIKREQRRRRVHDMVEMMAAMTGQKYEAIYEEFQERLQGHVESIDGPRE